MNENLPQSHIRYKVMMACMLVIITWGIFFSYILQGILERILAREGLAPEIILKISYDFTLISTGMMLVGIVLFLLISYYFANAISSPLRDLTEGVEKIAAGDLEVQVRVQSNDEFGRLAESFNRMVTDLRELDRLKADFITTVSHELRTPLATILGFAELLRDGEFSPEEKQEFVRHIQDKAETLSQLVDELLDISRFEEGYGIELSRSWCSPAELFARTLAELQIRTDRHRLQVDLPEQPLELYVDRLKVERVMENLLSNAVKYSPAGGLIHVVGTLENGWLRISVADQGIGMTREQMERIFDKFYRADTSNTAVGGFGLGMSIVRNIIEAHGGEISVTSEPGKGTCITFTLPVQAAGSDQTTGKEK